MLLSWMDASCVDEVLALLVVLGISDSFCFKRKIPLIPRSIMFLGPLSVLFQVGMSSTSFFSSSGQVSLEVVGSSFGSPKVENVSSSSGGMSSVDIKAIQALEVHNYNSIDSGPSIASHLSSSFTLLDQGSTHMTPSVTSLHYPVMLWRQDSGCRCTRSSSPTSSGGGSRHPRWCRTRGATWWRSSARVERPRSS